ncbi:MAG: peptidylprolyl isomerase [Verrucomicrobia bacterium]|nr:MAG: peptidylprolyl isomerase [Verrucomicrobiota bacterium]
MKRINRLFAVALLAVCGLALLPLCCAAFAAEPQATPQIVDGIAAVVNGDIITLSQVRELSAPREKVLRSQYTGAELEKQLKATRELALKDLIDRRLVIQAFKKEKYEIPDHFVEERMHEIIRENFGGDRNTFIKTLEAQEYTLGEFKQKEMESIIVQAMRGKNVKKENMVVPPPKIEEYYKQHRNEFTSKERIKLRLIMVPSRADTANAAAQRALAEEVLGQLAGGADFAQVAQTYSADSSRDLGGDWGWIERKTLAAPLEKIAFNMPVGRISNIIEYGGNYYILKVEAKEGGVTRSLAEARPDIEKKLIQEQAHDIQERWLAGLRAKAYIRTF